MPDMNRSVTVLEVFLSSLSKDGRPVFGLVENSLQRKYSHGARNLGEIPPNFLNLSLIFKWAKKFLCSPISAKNSEVASNNTNIALWSKMLCLLPERLENKNEGKKYFN